MFFLISLDLLFVFASLDEIFYDYSLIKPSGLLFSLSPIFVFSHLVSGFDQIMLSQSFLAAFSTFLPHHVT